MREAGADTAEFRDFMSQQSGNVDESGNFSIQVLQQALKSVGVDIRPAASPDAGTALQQPTRERAFICNLAAHWFTIVKLDDKEGWFNCNSLYPAPEPVGELHLDAFLRQVALEGYTIFVCRGNLPERSSRYGQPSHNGKWLTRPQAAELTAQVRQTTTLGSASLSLLTFLRSKL